MNAALGLFSKPERTDPSNRHFHILLLFVYLVIWTALRGQPQKNGSPNFDTCQYTPFLTVVGCFVLFIFGRGCCYHTNGWTVFTIFKAQTVRWVLVVRAPREESRCPARTIPWDQSLAELTHATRRSRSGRIRERLKMGVGPRNGYAKLGGKPSHPVS